MKTNTKSTMNQLLIAILLLGASLHSYAQSFYAPTMKKTHYAKKCAYLNNIGVELAAGILSYQLQSNIRQLNNLQTGYVGGHVGALFTNGRSKIKTTLGMYTSDDNTPYTINVYQAGFAWTYSLFHGYNLRSNGFEPYITLGATYYHSRFHGNYLGPQDQGTSTSQPYLGHAGWLLANIGAGVEYQFENESMQFIHPFLSATVGVPTMSIGSDDGFARTTPIATMAFTFGINFSIN